MSASESPPVDPTAGIRGDQVGRFIVGTKQGDEGARLSELETSYDLLIEEDPEDFVNVEIPSDSATSETTATPILQPRKRGGRVLRHLIRGGSPTQQKKWAVHEASSGQLELETVRTVQYETPESAEMGASPLIDSTEKELCVMAGSRDVSHDQYHSPASLSHDHHHRMSSSNLSGSLEEQEGTTAGLGLSHSTSDNSSDALSSDMLMSVNMGGAEMQSVRHSVHIGLAPSDLKLPPADEEMAKEVSRSRIDSIGSDHREFEDEDVDSTNWCQHKKHIFILSVSGKPVYSRYGKEDKLVNLFGIMQALVSFVQDDKDNLRSIMAGEHRFVFVCRGPLVFVAVSQTKQSDSQIAIQLNYVYNQILSVLTHTQLQQIFERSPGFDLRYLLQGSEKFVDNVLNMTDSDPSLLFAGVRCLPMPAALRQGITAILMQCRTKDVLFAILVAADHVVTYVKPREHNLLPLDIHLILNLVHASTSFRSAESWTPICLPKFNDTGFLHAHVSYLPYDSPACLLLFSTDKEKFFDLQECQQKIVERFEKLGYLDGIIAAVNASPYNISQLQTPELRHFVYKSRKTSCVTCPEDPAVYSDPNDKDRMFDMYMFMHQKLHSESWPTKILYHISDREALLGWRTTGFDLYALFDPLIAKAQAITIGNKLIRWIQKEEERLIITSSHTF